MREENELAARTARILADGEVMEIRAALVSEPDVPVALAARWWYDVFGTPTPPARPHDDRISTTWAYRHDS
jgi:hypothetical protein